MLDVIEKLLILQDRDRKLIRVRTELARVEPERKMLQGKTAATQAHLEAAKLKSKHIETERKKLELEVDACKQKIERYSLQQFQTKKNEEYKALAHEIDGCKAAIVKLEDQELELMEQMEAAQKESAASARVAAETKGMMDGQLHDLGEREENLKRELAELEANRNQLAEAVEGPARSRYERLLKSKGENAVVGIEHGVCGGCHMKFPTQILVSCKQEQEIVTCPNCARILYYTRDMDLAAVD
jgi:predicted  nucleic acid-binding Zn-ribbon protein